MTTTLIDLTGPVPVAVVRTSRAGRAYRATWPKVAALAGGLLVWQAVAASGWRPSYVLPGPLAVGRELAAMLRTAEFWSALLTTLRRAVVGFAIAVVLGSAAGLAVSRSRTLRTAFGSFITGIQTMPSIAWFPLAILLFKLSEAAILFVVVLGAAPAIANGLVTGVDYVPPLLLRAGRALGARGLALYRHVVLPASLPSYVAGLKQGWAFAWRSLMAGELLVVLANRPSLGVDLQLAREFVDAPRLIALMVVVLAVGIAVDGVFRAVDGAIRRRWGVAEH